MSDKKQQDKSEEIVKKDAVTGDGGGKKSEDSGKKSEKSKSDKKIAMAKAKLKHSSKEIDVKTFKTPAPLKKNPVMNILDQHRDHKMRIAKIISVIFITFVAIFFLALGYGHWTKVREKNKKISDIEKKLAIFKAKIEKNSGFVKNQAVAQAILLTYKGEKIDWPHAKEWVAKRKQLFSAFSSLKPLSGRNFVVPTIAMDMMAIPQGEFMMGRQIKEVKGCTDELPQRKVKIDYSFWMARTEIANFQYRVLFPQHTVKKYDSFPLNLTTQPVVQVSWHLATQYCKMLTYKERLKGRLPAGYVYRLPTEAEWEYACRAGSETYFYWGNKFEEVGKAFANVLDRHSAAYEDVAIYKESPKRDGHYVTAPVGSFKPNAFGLCDMSGNVWEWCWDWYNPAAYQKLSATNPVQSSPVVSELKERGNFERIIKIDSTSKVIRGGGWLSPPSDCRSATRDSVVPETKDNGIGFRIVLAPELEIVEIKEKEDKK